MSTGKKLFVFMFTVFSAAALLLTGITGYYNINFDESYSITKGSDFVINSLMPVTAEYKGEALNNCSEIEAVGNEITVDLKLFGIIPVKQTNVKVVSDTNVAVLGVPFGMKLYTDGVLVTDISNINTTNGSVCPADISGIKRGDYIISVDGKKIESNENLAEIIEDSGGKKLIFEICREDNYIELELTPVLSVEDNLYKAGIWIKDSSAGIGTLTFYSPENNIVCGLGHAIYDSDTSSIINFSKGELVSAEIISVNKGINGVPGELKGRLTYSTVAEMMLNNYNGVYGNLTCSINTENMSEIALKSEVKNGEAEILCTLDSSGVKAYKCEIRVKDTRVNDTIQNMTIEITDEELINKTGGIVQGMSGSPIIQNGKLIGAVTHVLIDDPTKGYGIFAENMLETAQEVAAQFNIKEAS